MMQVDIGGHSPIPLGAPPLSLSVFQFRHNLLFLAVFRVLNFRSHFEALNDVFWENCEIVCQSYVPEKLKHQFTQTGPIVLVLHLPGLCFWMFGVFHCFSIINMPSSLIVTQFSGLGADTSLLRDKRYQSPSSLVPIISVL